ncbi:MAG: hypothetical protein V4772_05925 [Pseudomonadota bacterium]
MDTTTLSNVTKPVKTLQNRVSRAFYRPITQKSSLPAGTYAQNLCHGVTSLHNPRAHRYQSHSDAKLLIHIASLNCFFSGQSVESLVKQGFGTFPDNLSTKLSTENLNIFKAQSNQALSAFFAGNSAELATNTYLPGTS